MLLSVYFYGLISYLFAPSSFVIVHVENNFSGASKVASPIMSYPLDDFDKVYVLTSAINNMDAQLLHFSKISVEYVCAEAGMHSLKLHRATVVGGYFRGCYLNTVKCLYEQNNRVRIFIPMECVYFGDHRTLYEYYELNYHLNNAMFTEYIKKTIKQHIGVTPRKIKIDKKSIVLQF